MFEPDEKLVFEMMLMWIKDLKHVYHPFSEFNRNCYSLGLSVILEEL